MTRTRTLVFALFVVAAPVGCALTKPIPADVRIPPELMRGSQYTAAGESPRTRYVVRMTDGQRDWEIQLPEIATAYEVKVPLSGKPSTRLAVDMATLTAADREIIQDREATERAARDEGDDVQAPTEDSQLKRASVREDSGDGRPAPKRAARKPGDDKPPAAKASYLLTLARVKDLYKSKQYELALVELAELDRQYPNDEHILSMKGSLYERLGNKKLAIDAWERVLQLNDANLSVMDALDRLRKNRKADRE